MMDVLRRSWVIALLLWTAVLVSAAGAVWTRHRARELFVEFEQLKREQQRLDAAWSAWQLELSWRSQHANVERAARQRLQMTTPDPTTIEVVTP